MQRIGTAFFRSITVGAAMVLTTVMEPSAYATSLHEAFEEACARTPEIQTLAARREVAEARRVAAEARLPGGPWATVTHRTDALTHDRGTREYDAELTVPLWLRGERGASLAVALTEAERLEAEIAFRRLEVAGRVREAYWTVVDAREKLAVAERRRASSTTLLRNVRAQGHAHRVPRQFRHPLTRFCRIGVVMACPRRRAGRLSPVRRSSRWHRAFRESPRAPGRRCPHRCWAILGWGTMPSTSRCLSPGSDRKPLPSATASW